MSEPTSPVKAPTIQVSVAYSRARGAPARANNSLIRSETADLDADLARLEAENAQMEKKLQVTQRPSFIANGIVQDATAAVEGILDAPAAQKAEAKKGASFIVWVVIMGFIFLAIGAVGKMMLPEPPAPPPPPPKRWGK